MNNLDPLCHQKDCTCDHWNQMQEGDPRQAHMPWNQYHGINKVFSPMLPPAAVPSSSTFISNSGMSSINDTSHSTVLQTSPSFHLQHLVWPMMTSTMMMNPSSFYLTSMPGTSSQSAFFIPMPVYGCVFPNNNSGNNNSNRNNNNFHSAPHATATTIQGGGYMIQSPILPPQLGMLNTQTSQSQLAIYSSMFPLSLNAFPNSTSQDKEDPYHSCLSLKIPDGGDNTSMHETSFFGNDDSFLLPPACKSSSQSRSVNHEPLESLQQQEGQQYAAKAIRSYHCFEIEASTEKEEHPPPKQQKQQQQQKR